MIGSEVARPESTLISNQPYQATYAPATTRSNPLPRLMTAPARRMALTTDVRAATTAKDRMRMTVPMPSA